MENTSNIHTLNEIIPGLFISSENTAYNREILDTTGISSIITLTGYAPFETDLKNTYLKLDCEDNIDTNILPLVSKANRFIAKQLAICQKVLVHCSAGVSRSGSIIIGFLINQYKCSYQEALVMAQKIRPCIQPNPGFAIQLDAFALLETHNNLVIETLPPPTEYIKYAPGLHMTTIDYLFHDRESKMPGNPQIYLFTANIDPSILQLIRRRGVDIHIINVRSSQLIDIIDNPDINWEQVLNYKANGGVLVIGSTPEMVHNLRIHYIAFKTPAYDITISTGLVPTNPTQNELAVNYYNSHWTLLPTRQIDNLLADMAVEIDTAIETEATKNKAYIYRLLAKLYDMYCITLEQREKKKELIAMLETIN